MQRGPVTPKGFRDILPEAAKKRREIINTIAEVLEEAGFFPVETPTIEFAETLKGKYGEEEKLIYEFTDRGGRDLALRYDLTVPLARFIANNLGLIEKGPFRRYQVGQVFRGENPQKGRYREFTQFDFDTVGLGKEPDSSIEEDAQVIKTVSECMKALAVQNYKILVNDRGALLNFEDRGLEEGLKIVRALDKLDKLEEDKVLEELSSIGISKEEAKKMLEVIKKREASPRLKEIIKRINDPKVEYSSTLARGLNYYTGMIFEVKIEGYPTSVAGGGRYDDLIGTFAGREIPAVGGSFGLDRIIDAMTDGLNN